MTTKRDYEDAIAVQNACNLSGVLHSFDKVIDRVWEDARANGQGTDWVNTHPLVRLFCDKLYDLSRTQGNVFEAYDIANGVIAGRIDPVTLEVKE